MYRFPQGLEAKVNKGKHDKIQITVSQREFITEEYTAAQLNRKRCECCESLGETLTYSRREIFEVSLGRPPLRH
jgi:predicted methyltransferase